MDLLPSHAALVVCAIYRKVSAPEPLEVISPCAFIFYFLFLMVLDLPMILSLLG